MSEHANRMIDLVDEQTRDHFIQLHQRVSELKIIFEKKLDEFMLSKEKAGNTSDTEELTELTTTLATIKEQIQQILNTEIQNPEAFKAVESQENGPFALMHEDLVEQIDFFETFLINIQEK